MPDIQHYLSPRTLEDALEALAQSEVTVVCGGTDVTPQTDAGRLRYASTLMNIRRIEGLSRIESTGGAIRIGTLATVTDIMTSALIRETAPVLVEAADQFASDQLRNAASIGGNICNASPAGDMIIPLLVLDASVELCSWKAASVHERRVPLCEFFTGPGRTVKQDDELLTAVVFEPPVDTFVAHFKKSGPRPALEIAKVSIGIGGRFDNGTFDDVRVAMGAVAPTPKRARRVEAVLEGKPLDGNSIRAAVDIAQTDATPIDDVRATAWYRNHLIRVYVEEVLNRVAEDRNKF
jgi:CO/xanthine dehydrogenase FAD-binding subunit